MKNIKAMIIIDKLNENSPTHIGFEHIYKPLYICYYGTYNANGKIDPKRIIKYKELSQESIIGNIYKFIIRTYRNIKNIIKYKPLVVITLHDYQLMGLQPTIIIIKLFYNLRIIKDKPLFLGEILNNPIEKYAHSVIGRLLYKLYGLYDILISQTTANIHNILKLNKGLQKKLYVQPNRTDVKYFIEKAKQIDDIETKTLQLFDGKANFLTIGRMTEQKGQWYLLRAFKKVTTIYPKAKLFFVGSGELSSQLKELRKKLSLEEQVIFLGSFSNPLPLIKLTDRYIMSSLWEGMPNTLLEAISLNTLCISTDCKNGPREILCPELSFDQSISYPYYGKYGILVKTPPRQYTFNDICTVPLIHEEKVLAETMIDLIKKKEYYQKRYNHIYKRGEYYDWRNHTKFREKLIQ